MIWQCFVRRKRDERLFFLATRSFVICCCWRVNCPLGLSRYQWAIHLRKWPRFQRSRSFLPLIQNSPSSMLSYGPNARRLNFSFSPTLLLSASPLLIPPCPSTPFFVYTAGPGETPKAAHNPIVPSWRTLWIILGVFEIRWVTEQGFLYSFFSCWNRIRYRRCVRLVSL